ncbi:DUF2232 domain-containing protein [Alkaliphilus transvaalensis]|uniref:DUF2232 domain-containing protein n=1 Tax=Alkaliphilus transvaalensis TaxID=114628 RepID=UPI00047E34C0|nr:DUF2232 domain-containing protein [Alkaliphilus transvaalensis]
MNTLPSNRGLVEAAMIATIASFFGIGYYYMPTLFLLIFLVPVPFIIITTRQSLKYGLFSLIVSSLITGILTDILFTLFLLIFFGPLSLVMGHLIKKDRDDFTVIGIGSAVSILTIFLFIQVISLIGGVNILEHIGMIVRDAIDNQAAALASMNLELIDIHYFFNYMMMIFPSLIIIQSIFVTFINYYVSLSILRRLRFSERTLPEFSEFKLPANIVLGSFLIMILSYLTRYFENIHTDNLINNVFLIFAVVFFIQGMASVSFFLKKKGIYKIVRVFIYILIILISPLLLLVSLLGLLDSMIDMRKIRQKQ